jgi:hypothetical protein
VCIYKIIRVNPFSLSTNLYYLKKRRTNSVEIPPNKRQKGVMPLLLRKVNKMKLHLVMFMVLAATFGVIMYTATTAKTYSSNSTNEATLTVSNKLGEASSSISPLSGGSSVTSEVDENAFSMTVRAEERDGRL